MEGWKLVPIDPTPEMLAAVWRRFELKGSGSTPAFKEAWKTMIDAAPEPPHGMVVQDFRESLDQAKAAIDRLNKLPPALESE